MTDVEELKKRLDEEIANSEHDHPWDSKPENDRWLIDFPRDDARKVRAALSSLQEELGRVRGALAALVAALERYDGDPESTLSMGSYLAAKDRAREALSSTPQPSANIGEDDVERLCAVHHDAYEEAARTRGWATNLNCRCSWAELPAANKDTMRAAMRALLANLPSVQFRLGPHPSGLTQSGGGTCAKSAHEVDAAGPRDTSAIGCADEVICTIDSAEFLVDGELDDNDDRTPGVYITLYTPEPISIRAGRVAFRFLPIDASATADSRPLAASPLESSGVNSTAVDQFYSPVNAQEGE